MASRDIKGRRHPEIIVGVPVYAADGTMLGRVRDVKADAFLVSAEGSPDFWVRTDIVDTANASRVTLTVREEEVNEPPV
jgi:hypothetical protein